MWLHFDFAFPTAVDCLFCVLARLSWPRLFSVHRGLSKQAPPAPPLRLLLILLYYSTPPGPLQAGAPPPAAPPAPPATHRPHPPAYGLLPTHPCPRPISYTPPTSRLHTPSPPRLMPTPSHSTADGGAAQQLCDLSLPFHTVLSPPLAPTSHPPCSHLPVDTCSHFPQVAMLAQLLCDLSLLPAAAAPLRPSLAASAALCLAVPLDYH